jgi:lysophospholipase L1-like esterase
MTTLPVNDPPAEPAPERPARTWLSTALAVAAQVVLILLTAEVILRVVGYQPPDLRPRLALFPRFPEIYQPNRDLGWVLKPSLDWTGMDVAIPFRTNAYGRRVHGDAPGGAATAAATSTTLPPEPAATVDCLGDSSTFGFGVPENETYPAQLEQRLRDATGDPALRVRNFGVPGYTSYEARLLAERDLTHAPVTVLWVGFNDHFPSRTYHTRARSLLRRRIAYACFRSRACAFFFDKLTARDPKVPVEAPPLPSTYLPDVSPDEYVDQLTRAVRALRAAGSEPILLIYPPLSVDEKMRLGIADFWKQPLDQVDANIAAHREYQDLTRRVAASESVRTVDLVAPFEKAGNEGLHFDWVHPNAAGQALIADQLAPVVRDVLAQRAAGGATAAHP